MADWFSEPRRNKSGIRRTIFAAGVFVTTGVCATAAAPDSGKVTAVRFWSLGDVTRIAIEVSSDFTFKYNHLSDPERMFFDIHGARPDLTNGARKRRPYHRRRRRVGGPDSRGGNPARGDADCAGLVADRVGDYLAALESQPLDDRIAVQGSAAAAGRPSVTGGKDLTVSEDLTPSGDK